MTRSTHNPQDAPQPGAHGTPASAASTPATAETGRPPPPAQELAPSLRALVEAGGLNSEKLSVALEFDGQKHIRLVSHHTVAVSDGEKMAVWAAPSLSGLFRGNRTPPPDLEHYPPEFMPLFFFIEHQVLTLCAAMGDRTDQELEEVYFALRRRPDGRSLGVTHDFLWQVCALLLAQYVLSATEFEALLGALVRSTRRWSVRPISRNYVAYLRRTFGSLHSATVLPR
jgi:hypothetical protein